MIARGGVMADDDLRVPGDTPKPQPLIADDDLRVPGAPGPPRPLTAAAGRICCAPDSKSSACTSAHCADGSGGAGTRGVSGAQRR